MKPRFISGCPPCFLGVALLAGATQGSFAQSTDFTLQTFDSNICGWNSRAPLTITFDPTQDDTGNGGGSCRVSFDLSQGGLFNLTGSFVSCCACALELWLKLGYVASVDFDVKWDNKSTATLTAFNSNLAMGSPGIALGVVGTNLMVTSPTLCYDNVFIPDAATNGWTHVSVPVNADSPYALGGGSGLYLEEEFAPNGTGTAAFWLDNVKLVFRTAPQLVPALSYFQSNSFTLQWTIDPSYTCSVLTSPDLFHWTTLTSGCPVSTITGIGSYTDTHATNSRAYYRVSTP
jgi:hypothetical protein